MTFDAARHAERRRPFERMEADLVRLARPDLDPARYVLAFARLTAVRNPDGSEVDLLDRMAPHAAWVGEQVAPRLRDAAAGAVWSAALPALLARTREVRRGLLDLVSRDALEAEVTTRVLAIASGGGGGAGYVYPGAYEMLDRAGLVPGLLVGTSVGALMSLFRAHQRDYTFTPLVSAARRLSWTGLFQVLETSHRYGMPGTLRMRLRTALGELFRGPDGGPLRLDDTAIPLVTVATGLTVEALAHGVSYADRLPDDDAGRSGIRSGLGGVQALQVARELLANRAALRCVALGRDEGTESFDAIDAVGFSSAVPGVLQYDLGAEDEAMRRVLDRLYARDGITRLVEGGLTSNVPARIAWETVASGRLGPRTAFVVALDCFAPNPRRIGWYPIQQAVRAANVEADRAFADLYVPFTRTLSPLNLMPTIRDAMEAVRWGRDELRPHLAFVRALCAPIPILPD